jgi:4'-phosphopantetheinyl transferase
VASPTYISSSTHRLTLHETTGADELREVQQSNKKMQCARLGRHNRSRLQLQADEVDVWIASLLVPLSNLRAFALGLSVEERARARHFRFKRHRRNFIAARGILRHILSQYVGGEPADLRFSLNSFGKPGLDPMRRTRHLEFNLSHSDQVALYAVTKNRLVGIDVERIKPELADKSIAELLFSLEETALIWGLPHNLRSQAFFECWTRKEAYLKGLGLGIGALDTDASVLASEVTGWKVQQLHISPTIAAAVAAPGNDWHVRRFQWRALPSRGGQNSLVCTGTSS